MNCSRIFDLCSRLISFLHGINFDQCFFHVLTICDFNIATQFIFAYRLVPDQILSLDGTHISSFLFIFACVTQKNFTYLMTRVCSLQIKARKINFFIFLFTLTFRVGKQIVKVLLIILLIFIFPFYSALTIYYKILTKQSVRLLSKLLWKALETKKLRHLTRTEQFVCT